MRAFALVLLLAATSACAAREAAGADTTSYDGDTSEAAGDGTSVDASWETTYDASCIDALDSAGDALMLDCASPISDESTFAEAPTAMMCTEANGHEYNRWTCACGGYLAVDYGRGTDCVVTHFFDATTGRHVAKLVSCVGWGCEEGPPTFVLPTECCALHDFYCPGAGEIMLTCPIDAG